MYDGEYEETVPDRSKSDYFCTVCQSHMNSEQMWISHIAGKRHQKNAKKEVGEAPSKVKNFKVVGERAMIQDMLDDEMGPMVGLSYMSERQASLRGGEPLYHCHLCHGGSTRKTILDHIGSTKHKMFFFRHNHPETARFLDSMKHLSKSSIESLLDEKASEWEERHGRGLIGVELRKPADWKPPLSNKPIKDWNKKNFNSRQGSSSQSSMKSDEKSSPMYEEAGPEPLAMSEAQKNFKRFSLEDQLDLIKSLTDNLPYESKEDRTEVLKVSASMVKSILLPKIRILPPELKNYLARDYAGEMLTIRDVLNDITNNKKRSYYFSRYPAGR